MLKRAKIGFSEAPSRGARQSLVKRSPLVTYINVDLIGYFLPPSACIPSAQCVIESGCRGGDLVFSNRKPKSVVPGHLNTLVDGLDSRS